MKRNGQILDQSGHGSRTHDRGPRGRRSLYAILVAVSLLVSGCQAAVQERHSVFEGMLGKEAASQVTADASRKGVVPQQAVPMPISLPAQELSRDHWQRLDTTGGSGQTSFAVHPTKFGTVYLASANGGLFKTENSGDTWFSVSSNLGAYRLGYVTLDPLDPEVVYVTASTQYGSATSGGGSGEIYCSTNGGRTWAFVSGAMGFQNIHNASLVIPYDPSRPGRYDQNGDRLSDTIVVGAWTGPADPPVGGIWRSQDQGQTFVHLAFAQHNVTALRAYHRDPETLFVTTFEGQIYRSRDLGEIWADITGNLPLAHLADVAIDPDDANKLYVTCLECDPTRSPVWTTEDGGQHWRAIGNGIPVRETSERNPDGTRILIDRFDPDTLYLSTLGYPDSIYKSTNGGRRWQPMPSTLVLPDGRPFFWYRIDGSYTIEQAFDGRLYADGGGAWRYPDTQFLNESPLFGQPKWEPATLGVGNVLVNALAIDPTNDDVLYQGISDFGPYKSTNRGATFYRILGTGWPVTTNNYVWNGPYYSNYEKCALDCSPSCDQTGAIAAGGTTDWAISRQDPNIVYSSFGSGDNKSRHGGVNKSLDGGATWQPVGFQLQDGFELNPDTCVPYGFRHLAIDPSDDQVVFAVMEMPDASGVAARSRVYRTTDGGVTWMPVYDADGRIEGIEVSALDPSIVVLVTRAEVMASEQGGDRDSWRLITPAGAGGLRAVALSPHQAGVFVVGTSSQGFWYSADAGVTWTQNKLDGFFEQLLSPDEPEPLEAALATAHDPDAVPRRDISVIVFSPIDGDTFYVAGTQRPRASVGVARITQSGTRWERLPLTGLTHRDVAAMAIDSNEQYLYVGTHDGTFGLALK